MATTSAVGSAVTPAVTGVSDVLNSVNTPAGTPAQERYPGALNPLDYQEGSYQPPGGTAGPPYGSWGAEPFTETLPEQAPGGGYQDTSWMTGHDAPEAPWDSQAGAPFAPSGAVDPMLHAEDTGGVYVREYVVPAEIGQLTRRTSVGQTTIRNGSGNQVTKDNVTSPNDRVDYDQYQDHNPDGFDPWEIPYGERPIFNNVAYENTALNDVTTNYGVAGQLSDRSVYDYSAVAYDAPPDPSVSTINYGTQNNGIGGGWV